MRAAEIRGSKQLMQDIVQQITTYFQQMSASFPWIPAWGWIFLLVLVGFLALVILLLFLRLFWNLVEAIFGFKRRKRARGGDPAWERQLRLQALRQQHHWQRGDYY